MLLPVPLTLILAALEAIGLLHQIHSFKFVSCLVHCIMGITKSLSDQLQSREIDLTFAADLVISTSDTLKGNNDTWDHTFTSKKLRNEDKSDNIKDLTECMTLFLQLPVLAKRPHRMDDFVSHKRFTSPL